MFEYCQLIIDNDTAQLSGVIADQPAIANARIDRDHLFLGKASTLAVPRRYLAALSCGRPSQHYHSTTAQRWSKTRMHDSIVASAPCFTTRQMPASMSTFSRNSKSLALQLLIDAGVCLNAQDKNGGTALHRAVRTRAADAVAFLLKSGADPYRMNCAGSTAFHLAVQTTGRGGSGTPQAKEAQIKIIESFMQIGISSTLRDGRGKTV